MQNCKLSANVSSWKKFYITLYKAQEAFLLTCQDPAALNNVILQMTDCVIRVPTVELTDDLKEEERLKVGSEEGICYSLTNDYYKTYYIYPNDTVLLVVYSGSDRTSLRTSGAEFRCGALPVCGVLVLITDFYIIMYLGNFMFLDKHLLFTMQLTL